MRVVASTLLHKLENFNGTMTLPSVGFAFRTYLNNCRRGAGETRLTGNRSGHYWPT